MKPNTRKDRVTLKTVAEKAGVSVATVSLILSGREEWLRQFHADTIARVQQCAKRLGYRANLFATGLPMKTSAFFSLVLESLGIGELGSWHHWAFEGSLLAGVVQAAIERRMYPVVATAHSDTDESGVRQISKIINGGVFGSIVRTPNAELEKFLRTRMRQGHPVVVVFPRRLTSWPTNAMDVDNTEVGRTAARILLQRGRQQWAIVRYQKPEDAHRLRSDGFCEFAREAGIPLHTVQLALGTNEFAARDEILRYLKRTRVDALFAINSVASLGASMASNADGRRPGEDLDVIGCDCSVFQGNKLPTTTSVDISWREVGKLAFRKLVEISEQHASSFETVLLHPTVQPGDTCPIQAGQIPPTEITITAPLRSTTGAHESVRLTPDVESMTHE